MKDQLIGQQFLAIPVGALPNDPQIFIGVDIPAAVITTVQAQYGVTMSVIAVIKYQRDANDYWFDALINDATNQLFAVVRGVISGVSGITQQWLYNLISNTTSETLGMGAFDTSVTLGPGGLHSNVRVLQDPINRVELDATTAIRLMLSATEKFRIDATSGVQIPLDVGYMIDNVSGHRGTRDAYLCTAGNVAAVTNVSGEKAIPSASYSNEPTITFKPGHLYSIRLTCHAYQSAVTESWTKVRVRVGAQSTAGIILGTFQLDLPAIGGSAGGTALARTLVTYCTNATGSDVSTKLSITNQWGAGAATIQLYGDGTIPIRMLIEDIGAATNNPGISAVSVA